MPLTWSDLTPDEHDRVAHCVHESGHAVAAALAGALIAECWATADGGRVRFVGHDRQRDPGIAWAGIYAEHRFIHGAPPPLAVLRDALADASREDRALLAGVMPRHIEPDIEFAMPAILRLAGHLYQHGRASNRHVERALGVRTDMPVETVRHHFAHRQPIPARTAGVLA